jgi:tail assembly chaperone
MRLQMPTETRTFDGETYEITMLDGVACHRLYVKLVNAVGGAIGSLSKPSGAGSEDELMVRALGSVLGALSPELHEEIRSTYADSCVVHDGDKRPRLKNCFGAHFAGRPAHMTKWLFECTKVNFADFLDESGPLGALIAKIKAKVAPKSPTTSIGSPVDS